MAEKPKKSNRGGVRPNSGRPRTKTVESLLSNRLISELESMGDDLLPAIRELVRGVTVQTTDARGRERIYMQPPSAQMIMYVADRLIGKPKQSVELTGKQVHDVHVSIGSPREPEVDR